MGKTKSGKGLTASKYQSSETGQAPAVQTSATSSDNDEGLSQQTRNIAKEERTETCNKEEDVEKDVGVYPWVLITNNNTKDNQPTQEESMTETFERLKEKSHTVSEEPRKEGTRNIWDKLHEILT